MSLLWLLIWQVLNEKRQYKRCVCTDEIVQNKNNVGVGADKCDQNDKDNNDKTSNKETPDGLQEGADGWKFQLGCAIPSGMHSSPIGKD